MLGGFVGHNIINETLKTATLIPYSAQSVCCAPRMSFTARSGRSVSGDSHLHINQGPGGCT